MKKSKIVHRAGKLRKQLTVERGICEQSLFQHLSHRSISLLRAHIYLFSSKETKQTVSMININDQLLVNNTTMAIHHDN